MIEPGTRFGRLTVIANTEKKRYYLCKCDCGNTKEIRDNHLTCGLTLTCAECPIFELPGKKIGKLTVLEYATGSSGRFKHRKFRCLCDCGKETYTHASSLLNGSVSSCGQCIDKHSKVGKKFGHLRVISWAGTSHTNSKWNCICDCGKETISHINLQNKNQSCGCARLVGCQWGERGSRSKLTEEQVKECRNLWVNELISRRAHGVKLHRISMQSLADKYHVSHGCIFRVLHSQSWFFIPSVQEILDPINDNSLQQGEQQ